MYGEEDSSDITWALSEVGERGAIGFPSAAYDNWKTTEDVDPYEDPNETLAELRARILRTGERALESWNHEHPIGSRVVVTHDNGETVETTVRGRAVLLGGHLPVVWVDGISGGINISRIRALAKDRWKPK